MAKCKICDKELNEFELNICQTCLGKENAVIKSNIRKWVLERFQNRCIRCGYNEFIACLDSHHTETRRKQLMNEKIQVPLCKNCHQALNLGLITNDDIFSKINFEKLKKNGKVEILG